MHLFPQSRSRKAASPWRHIPGGPHQTPFPVPRCLCALRFPLHRSSFLSHELQPSQKYLISHPDLAARVCTCCCPGKGCKDKHLGSLFGCTLFLVGVRRGCPVFVPSSRAFFFIFANQIVGKAVGGLGRAARSESILPAPSRPLCGVGGGPEIFL